MDLTNVLNQPTLNIHVYDGEDGYITAECIDIPGCISQGKTREEALTNIMDAISVCLEIIMERASASVWEAPASDNFKLSLTTSQLLPV